MLKLKPIHVPCRLLAAVLMLGILGAPPARADEPSIIGKFVRRVIGRDDTSRGAADRRTQYVPPSESLEKKDIRLQDSSDTPIVLTLSETSVRNLPEPLDPTDHEVARFEGLAIERNPTMHQARAAVEAACGRQLQSQLYPNPTIGYVGSEIGNEGRAGQQGFTLSQEIVRGNKLRLASTAAAFEREQIETHLEIQFWRLRNTVRSLYFETLVSQETTRLMDELQSIAQKAEEIARQRERAGEGTLADVLQTQIELEQVRLQAASALNNQLAIWKRLAAVVGQPNLPLEQLHGSLEFDPPDREESGTLAGIVSSSPEIQMAKTGVLKAEAALARARAEPVPNVTLEAGTQYDYASRDTIVGLGLALPIPLNDRNQGNVIAAASELRRARHEIDRVHLAIADRYATAFGQYRNALQYVNRYGVRLAESEVTEILASKGEERQRALDAHPQIVPRAQLALALATEGWQRGEFNYLQVLTAQRSLTQVRLGYVRALGELRQSLVALDGYLLSERSPAGMETSSPARPEDPSIP
jgi:cobalt-zinc-cadmium efflux system outer membrane protein